MTLRPNRVTSLVVLLAFSLTLPGVAAEGESYSLLKPSGNVKEYFSPNRDNRLLIKVQIWGDTALAGVHYIPDNTTLLDMLGYLGGVQGQYDKATVLLARTASNVKEEERRASYSAPEILDKPEVRSLKLAQGDVLIIDAPPKADNLIRTLTIVSTVLGIISAGAAVYLLTKR